MTSPRIRGYICFFRILDNTPILPTDLDNFLTDVRLNISLAMMQSRTEFPFLEIGDVFSDFSDCAHLCDKSHILVRVESTLLSDFSMFIKRLCELDVRIVNYWVGLILMDPKYGEEEKKINKECAANFLCQSSDESLKAMMLYNWETAHLHVSTKMREREAAQSSAASLSSAFRLNGMSWADAVEQENGRRGYREYYGDNGITEGYREDDGQYDEDDEDNDKYKMLVDILNAKQELLEIYMQRFIKVKALRMELERDCETLINKINACLQIRNR